jgi:hypothetical protein
LGEVVVRIGAEGHCVFLIRFGTFASDAVGTAGPQAA